MNVAELKYLVDKELNIIYPQGPQLLEKPINYIIRGGKRLRPILCLLICSLYKYDLKKAIIPAVSIELLHIFSLIHDDIMDQDELRHNKLTIHKKWNESVAILSGDAILALAFKRLNNVDNNIKELFNSALIAVCEGQALDIEYENKDNITIKQYMSMVDLKTSHMIGLCAELAGVLCNLSKEKIIKLKKYGQNLGRAFQIQDDLLEVISDNKTMGKSLSSDFLLNKNTYLMIKAKQNFANEVKYIQKKTINDFELSNKLFKDLLNDNGIVEETRNYINNIFLTANDLISDIDKGGKLLAFTKMLKNRKC